jgi:hypothetical protein
MGSISGALALPTFIGGLFCRRLKTALIVGAVLVLFYLLLVAETAQRLVDLFCVCCVSQV